MNTLALTLAAALIAGATSAATLKPSATVVLELPLQPFTAGGVSHDPVRQLYYSGIAGIPDFSGYTANAAGVMQESAVMGIDIRGVWYNPNTGKFLQDGLRQRPALPIRS